MPLWRLVHKYVCIGVSAWWLGCLCVCMFARRGAKGMQYHPVDVLPFKSSRILPEVWWYLRLLLLLKEPFSCEIVVMPSYVVAKDINVDCGKT